MFKYNDIFEFITGCMYVGVRSMSLTGEKSECLAYPRNALNDQNGNRFRCGVAIECEFNQSDRIPGLVSRAEKQLITGTTSK